MTVGYSEGVRTIRRRKRESAVFFLWVIFFLAQFGSLFAAPDETISGVRSFRFSPARKILQAVVFDKVSIDAAPASSPSDDQKFKEGINGDTDALYGDDKRLIHTGPNPLHN